MLARDATFDNFAVFVDVIVLVKDMAEGDELIERGTETAEGVAEGRRSERNGEANDTAGDFVGGGFRSGPVELEIAGVEIVKWIDDEHEEFETEESKGDG